MLLEFFGRECGPCMFMRPLVQKLEKETGVELKKYEVWHDEKNAEFMQKYIKGRCLGVPFFFNTTTGGFICGATDYKNLKEWAVKEKKSVKQETL